MMNKVEMLDCTLRDGAYIVNAEFGTAAIKGIMRNMQDANIKIIECGWLKNTEHILGTTFYHVPDDLKRYIVQKRKECIYTVMIDWDRYNLEYLPIYDGQSVDAIRVVFPHGKAKEGVEVGKQILEKGYRVFFQAANTLAYSKEDLVELAKEINETKAEALSIVDTFGAMYEEDLEKIMSVLDKELNESIALGFHSHNNQQLSFALSIKFVEWMKENSNRMAIVDSSLCGMGRGAGNATTELVANYLNRKQLGNYDMDMIMDAIDTYMQPFQEKYTWGYSTPYFIAGMYCCHVNNIAYLINNHRTNAKDMRNIIQSLSSEDRKKYDYDLLEEKYIQNQNRIVDDENEIANLKTKLKGKKVLLIAPGKRAIQEKEKVEKYIAEDTPVIIDVNAITDSYPVDYLFVINDVRYEYAKNSYSDIFESCQKILLSSVKNSADEGEHIINFSKVVKTGWEHFDNAVIYCLRLLDKLEITEVAIAGFDEFKEGYNSSYSDPFLPTVNSTVDYKKINKEIKEMLDDFKLTNSSNMNVKLITTSEF
ncbi:aldolase catalytic domain-containing protein [Firmicutes bacterium i23-0019-B6]